MTTILMVDNWLMSPHQHQNLPNVGDTVTLRDHRGMLVYVRVVDTGDECNEGILTTAQGEYEAGDVVNFDLSQVHA